MDGTYKGVGGWEGGKGGWEAKGGLRVSLGLIQHNNSVCPVSDTNSHNLQDRPIQHWVQFGTTHTGPTGSVVHLCCFTRLAKGPLGKQTWPSLAICLVHLGSARVQF